MLNPTGLGIRSDPAGDGHYRAKRGSRLHAGLDLLCDPYQPIKAPIAGKVSRQVQVYKDDTDWKGVEIIGERMTIKLFYMVPIENLLGTDIEVGTVLGFAQDISKKYGVSMQPHIHVEITKIDPECLLEI